MRGKWCVCAIPYSIAQRSKPGWHRTDSYKSEPATHVCRWWRDAPMRSDAPAISPTEWYLSIKCHSWTLLFSIHNFFCLPFHWNFPEESRFLPKERMLHSFKMAITSFGMNSRKNLTEYERWGFSPFYLIYLKCIFFIFLEISCF